MAISSEDYFVAALRLNQDNSPGTPKGGAGGKRCASFSPRIIFYDTWPSGEYDRRGEIATCNRLTPMLAQQIKEELNTFKMVCRLVFALPIFNHVTAANNMLRKWRCTRTPRSTRTSSDEALNNEPKDYYFP